MTATPGRTYGNLRLVDGGAKWEVSALEPHVAIRLKQLFPRVPKQSSGPFHFPRDLIHAADLYWFTARYPLSITPADHRALVKGRRGFDRQQAEMERILLPDYAAPQLVGLREGQQIRHYQSQAIELLRRRRSLLLGDEGGLGKTYSAAGFLCAEPGALPAAVVCDAHMQKQWKDKIEAFTTLRTHLITKTTPYDLPPADVYIFRVTQIAGWTDIFATRFFKAVIYDEPQSLRTGTGTAKGAAAKVLSRSVDYRAGLSVGPDSFVELVGGPFAQGWVGPIAGAWEKLKAHSLVRNVAEYEILDAIPTAIMTRGWRQEGGWAWKPVKTFIRHACNKTMHAVHAGGRCLEVTEDHSIYLITKDGITETRTSEITKGALVPLDNGNDWESVAVEVPLAIEPLVANLSRCQAVVDLTGFTRHDFGLSPQEWQNCHREATYGSRLPYHVFAKHRTKLPNPTMFYLGRGKAPCLPTHIMLSDWAYVLGFYLGDGWLSDETRVCFAVETARVDGLSTSLLNMGIGMRPQRRKMKGASYELRCSHRMLGVVLNHLFNGARCHEKLIPGDWIVSWPREARMQLLKGLVDSDGHISKRDRNRLRAYYITTSQRLANGVLALARSLGIAAGIHIRKTSGGGVINGRSICGKRPSYVVDWSGHSMVGVSKKMGKCGNRHRYKWTRDVTLEAPVTANTVTNSPEWVYDIEVEGHPSFCANGLLVHNTATPIYNYGTEMWNVTQFLDDQILGSNADFSREWVDHNGRIQDPKALGTYLREQHFLLRRLKSDVGQELPKVSRIVEYVEYDTKTVQSVEELAHRLAIRATNGSFVERGQAVRELDMMVRHATGVSKAKAVAQFVRMLVEAGESVLLLGWHRDVYEIWLRELKDLAPAMYTGSETATKKNSEKDRFVNRETPVMIMSLRSGAGIDGLQHMCSIAVFGELDWSPGIHQQDIWRLDREGQLNPVTAFFLVVDEGSDPPIMDVLGIKASEATQIVDPHLGVQHVEEDTSNLKRLVERYLTKSKGGGALGTGASIV